MREPEGRESPQHWTADIKSRTDLVVQHVAVKQAAEVEMAKQTDFDRWLCGQKGHSQQWEPDHKKRGN